MGRKIHKLDKEATESANFLDSRSYWTVMGTEHLFGDDMKTRRAEVFNRDYYKCRLCGVAVDFFNGELDHYPISRGKGGEDSLSNLRTLCGPCHRKRHPQVRWTKNELKETK